MELPPSPLFGDVLMPILVLDDPLPQAIAAVAAREALQRFLTRYYAASTQVGLTPHGPERARVTFTLASRTAESADGLLYVEQLMALAPEGALDGELGVVMREAEELADVAARFVAAGHAITGMPSLASSLPPQPKQTPFSNSDARPQDGHI